MDGVGWKSGGQDGEWSRTGVSGGWLVCMELWLLGSDKQRLRYIIIQ